MDKKRAKGATRDYKSSEDIAKAASAGLFNDELFDEPLDDEDDFGDFVAETLEEFPAKEGGRYDDEYDETDYAGEEIEEDVYAEEEYAGEDSGFDDDEDDFLSDDGKYTFYSSQKLKKPVRDSSKSPGYRRMADRDVYGSARREPEESRPVARSSAPRSSAQSAPRSRTAPASAGRGLSQSDIRFVGVAAAIIVLLLAAFVVFKMSDMSKKLTAAEERADAVNTVQSQLDEAKLTISSLEGEVSELRTKNAELQAIIDAGTINENDFNETAPAGNDDEDASNTTLADNSSAASGNTTNSAGTTNSLPTTHTVTKGDSLYSLSVKYYGSGAYWKKIAEANGIPDENIVDGTVLTIPEI